MELYKQGEYEKAAEKLVLLLDFDKTNPKAWNALGVCLSKLQDYQQAHTCFLNAVKFDPDNQTYLKNLTKTTEKIAKPPGKHQSSIIRKIKRTFSDFAIGTTEYACFALGCILCAIFYLLPLFGIVMPSPAHEIIGLCGLLFILLFVISTIIRYLQYLGLQKIHAVIIILTILIIAFPIYHLLTLQGMMPFSSNISEYQNRPSAPVITPQPDPMNSPSSMGTPTVPEEDVHSGDLVNATVSCPKPDASFEYQIISLDPYQVQYYDRSSALPSPVSSIVWDFGDQTTATETNPVHEYTGSPQPYSVNLTVRNECGESGSLVQTIEPVYANISPILQVIPGNGTSPLTVTCFDLSTPHSDITAWRWTFGDGEIFETTRPENRNTTHTYTKMGSYYVTLTVINPYRQEFSAASPVNVLGSSTITGNLWSDDNINGIRESIENNLTGWQVNLDKQEGSQWKSVQSSSTDNLGTYHFTITDDGGIYRVRAVFPFSGIFDITNADNAILPNASDPIPLYESGLSYHHNFGIVESGQDQYHEVSLMSSRSGSISAEGMIRWHQIGNDGIVTVNGSSSSLKDGSLCEISYLNQSEDSQISITGGLQAHNLSSVSVSIDGRVVGSGDCSQLISPLISGYSSNLQINLTPKKDAYTTLIWDGVEVPVSRRQTLSISGLMPTENQRMELNLSPGMVYFSGRALSYE